MTQTSTVDTTPTTLPQTPATTPVSTPPANAKASRAKPATTPSKPAAAAPAKPIDARTIKLLPVNAETKLAKPGSKREARFALYRDGMSVDQYVEAGGRRRDVERDVKAGRISVSG